MVISRFSGICISFARSGLICHRSTTPILACPVQESHRLQVEQLEGEKATTDRQMAEVEQQHRQLTAKSAAVVAELTAKQDRLLVWGRLGRFVQTLRGKCGIVGLRFRN